MELPEQGGQIHPPSDGPEHEWCSPSDASKGGLLLGSPVRKGAEGSDPVLAIAFDHELGLGAGGTKTQDPSTQ